MTARTWAVALTGLNGHMVDVEADLSQQTPGFDLIGLGDRALGEAARRIAQRLQEQRTRPAAPQAHGEPVTGQGLPKHGSAFDVAIAIAARHRGALDPVSLARTVHLGELGLDGRLRPVPGVLPALHAAREAGFERTVVPFANEAEARLVPGMEVHAAVSLAQVALLHGADVPELGGAEQVLSAATPQTSAPALELADVIGRDDAVAALVVAAAGGHHLLLSGPPGAGKTMLARRLAGILPDLDEGLALEAASIRSLAGETLSRLGCVRRSLARTTAPPRWR